MLSGGATGLGLCHWVLPLRLCITPRKENQARARRHGKNPESDYVMKDRVPQIDLKIILVIS